MISVILSLFLTLAACTSCRDAEVPKSLTAAPWILLTDSWTEAPPESGMTAWAPAKVLRFKSDGSFSMVYCILNKGGPATEIGISAGEGQTVFAGRWEREHDNRLSVKYRKIEESFPPINAAPEPEESYATATLDGPTLHFGSEGEDFKQEPSLSAVYYDETFDGIIAYTRDHPP